MERAIGEVFEVDNNKFKVVEDVKCDNCFFDRGEYCFADLAYLHEIIGECSSFDRKSKDSVIFVKIVD